MRLWQKEKPPPPPPDHRLVLDEALLSCTPAISMHLGPLKASPGIENRAGSI